eukprot:scaffold93400_cov41-Attheya_sp.AAC.1
MALVMLEILAVLLLKSIPSDASFIGTLPRGDVRSFGLPHSPGRLLSVTNNGQDHNANNKKKEIVYGAATRLDMILGGGGGVKKDESLPRDVKEAVSRCRASVQEALGKRISRMDIEMPVGAKFGVEKASKKKDRRTPKEEEGGSPTQDRLDTSDRELARLFVDMFQPLGGEQISVIFNEETMSDSAKAKWSIDSTAMCRILTMGRRSPPKKQKNAKKPKGMGFAAKMNAQVSEDTSEGGSSSGPFQLPEKCEVALFVAPGPKELVTIERICSEAGMGTLVILLNARLQKVTSFATQEAKTLFMEEFDPIFCLGAGPQDVAPGCLLHRSYPNDWILARKPKVGSPKTILVQPNRPTPDECQTAYENIQLDDLEKGVENVLDNVASWFK